MFLSINFARFHPLLVHLPIGILIFAAVLEVMKWKRKNEALDLSIRLALLTGFLSAFFAAATGWFLSEEGGYNEEMLWQHQWAGIGLTVLSLLLYLLKRYPSSLRSKLYRPLFILVLLLLFLTGHFGGNLTHGSDYLFSKPEDPSIVVVDIEQAEVFSTIIEPILQSKCNSCHNASKAKGDLIMTSPEALLVGGKTGLLFDFDQPEKSELLRRIHLDQQEKEHMPPKGKKQLTRDEKKLLLWWIENKACTDCLVGTTKNRAAVASILKKYQTQDSDLTRLKLDPIDNNTLKKANQLGLKINRLAEGSSLLVVNLSDKETIDRSAIKFLKRIGENVVELNLANTRFSNQFSALLSAMPHLKKLQIQRTEVKDETIEDLKAMNYLSSLNIYNTSLTDQAVETLKGLTSLKKLYCWNTKISAQAIAALQNALPKLYISYQLEESIFADSKLNAPEIFARKDIFLDSMSIRFGTNLKKAKFYYTLDGSAPDTSAQTAVDSFWLKESATVKVIAQAKSWGISPIAKRDFIQSKIKIKSAKLKKAANEKYKADGAKSLIDLKKGTKAIMEGNWLGYQGEHLEASLELAEKQRIKKILVSSFSAPLSWIFFPQKIMVWTSLDGKQYTLQKEERYASPLAKNEQELKYFELQFEPREAKFVRVKIFSLLKNPDWHPAPGKPCWIFIDEVLVE